MVESYQRHHSCPLLFMPTQCRPQGKMFTIWQKGASWGRAAGRHMMGHSQAPSEDPGTYLGRATAPRARGPAGERGSDTALELGQCSHTYTHARARARTHTHTHRHTHRHTRLTSSRTAGILTRRSCGRRLRGRHAWKRRSTTRLGTGRRCRGSRRWSAGAP